MKFLYLKAYLQYYHLLFSLHTEMKVGRIKCLNLFKTLSLRWQLGTYIYIWFMLGIPSCAEIFYY
jgi:hypothetical protein